MATENDQYANLFGSSDEESGDDEAPPPPPPARGPAPASAPAPADASSSSSSSSSSEESESESEEEERPAKKRLLKGKKGRRAVVRKPKPAASSGESSSEDEGKAAKPKPKPKAKAAAAAARPRGLGTSALDRAAADFEEPPESDEEGGGGGRQPFVARSVSSGSSGEEDGNNNNDWNSSDEEADSRRRKRLQKKKPAAARRRKGKAAARGGSDDEGHGSDSDRGRGSGATAAARRPGRELSVVEQALQKLKRNRGTKLPEKEVQERTQRLIDIMEAAAKEDRLALAQGRPGLSKVSKLQDVLDLLRSKHLQGALVDNGQLLGLIKAWIQPLPDKSLPIYSVRTPLIEYLVNARVEVHRLKESGIGSVIQRLRKHPDETLENKARLSEIVDNWSRLITGKGTHLKTSMHAEDGRAVGSTGGGGGPGGDGYIYAKTSRGVEIPIRPGYNFKKVALSFKGMDDRGQGKEDEAMEVMEREPRGDGVESRATKVRKALKDMGRKGSGKRLRAENVSHSAL